MLLRIALIAFFATFSASLAPVPAETNPECTATETTPGTGCACC